MYVVTENTVALTQKGPVLVTAGTELTKIKPNVYEVVTAGPDQGLVVKLDTNVVEQNAPAIPQEPLEQYSGQEGIAKIVRRLQTEDLITFIMKDDNKQTVVNLGKATQFPDVNKSEWIAKLNALIPIASAISVGVRNVNGEPCLTAMLHEGFV